MRTDFRLAYALLRGAGPRDRVRAIAMILSVGFALYAVLIGIAAPRAQADAHDVIAARTPLWSQDGRTANGLRLQTVNAVLDDQPFTRVDVSGDRVGELLPPGLTAWPRVGETVPSPALRALAARDPKLVMQLGHLSGKNIGESGLTAPDELFAYRATKDAAGSRTVGATSTPVVVGFGNSDGVQAGSGPFLLVEIVILIMTPAALFLVTALRLSALSRERRSFALGLAGMSPSRNARLYGWEMTAVAAAGFLLGAIAYNLTQSSIGNSGLLGVRWWPTQGSFNGLEGVVGAVVTIGTVRWLARRAMRTAAQRSRSQRDPKQSRVATGLAGVIGLPAFGFLLVVDINGLLHPTRSWAPDGFAAMAAAAILGCVLALVLGTPGLVATLGRLAADHVPPTVALGLRGASLRTTATRRLIAFVATAVMLAGLSAAFVAALWRGAYGDPSEAEISFDVAAASANPNWYAALPAGPKTIDTAVQGDAGLYDVVIGDCPAILRQAQVVFSKPGPCADALQHASGGIGGETARTLVVGGTKVAVPASVSTGNYTWDLKYPTAAAPWAAHLTQGQVTYWVSRSNGSYQQTLADLSDAFPNLAIQAGLKDPARYNAYEQQVGVVRAAATLGIWLSVCSFLLAALESRWTRARSVAALTALGVPRRSLRIANAVEFGYPVLCAVIPAVAIGVLGGWALLSFWGTDGMFVTSVPAWTATGAALTTVLAAVGGWATGYTPFRREALADE